MSNKKLISLRLSEKALSILETKSKETGLSRTALIELIVRKLEKQVNI